jgi:excisionase family DNA binding protein
MMPETPPPLVPKDRPVVTIHQAMAKAQVSRRTIYLWLQKGQIQYVRTAGGSVRIFEDSLFRGPTS